jgi:hypothetical protein
MLLTEAFCATNTFVQHCFAFRESKTFDASDTPWVFEWGRLDDIELPIEQSHDDNGNTGDYAEKKTRAKPYYPKILNTPEYRKDARAFMTAAWRKILMHGFCCVSYLKGRAAAEWWAAYERAGPHERQQLGLNMKVVDTHRVSFRVKLSKLASKAGGVGPSELVADYLFAERGVEAQQGLFVFSERPDFVPTGPLMWGMAQKMYNQSSLADGRGHIAMGPCLEASLRYGQINSVQANSPFTELIRMQADLEEMKSYNMDARAVLAHGQLYYEIQTLDLKNTNLDYANNQAAFTGNPLNVLMDQAMNEQRFALDEAAEVLCDMQEEVFGKRKASQMPVGVQRRQMNNRPDMREDIVRVPKFMKLAHIREPQYVDDTEKIEQEMRRQIAAILRVPLSMLESGSKTATPSGQSNMMGGKTVLLSHEDGEVEDMVREDREFYGRFFLSCWLQTMGAIDIEAMDDIYKRLLVVYDKVDARLERHRLDAGNELFKELAPFESTADDEESTRDESTTGGGRKKKKGDSEINNIEDLKEKTRVNIIHVRRLLEQLQTRHDCGATLVFQPSLTQDAMHSLAGVMELAAMQLVSAKSMEPFAQAVYPGLKLQEPPQPVGPAAATAAPKKPAPEKKKKKKKKKKKSTEDDDDDEDDDADAEKKKKRGKKRKREEDDEEEEEDDDDDDDEEKAKKKARRKRAKRDDD